MTTPAITATAYASTHRHVMGYSWRGVAGPQDQEAPAEGAAPPQAALSPQAMAPALRVRVPHSDAESELLPIEGELCLTPLGERRCVGHRHPEDGSRVPCPDWESLPLTTGDGQCARCKDEEGFSACIRCDGVRCPSLPPAAERYCLQEHHLYLADFGEDAGRVKVGTASEGRRLARLVEQGALAAAYVAAAPGPVIKRLEKQVAALGLTERMTRRRKGASVFAPADLEGSRARILEAYRTVLDGLRSEEASALHAPELVSLPSPATYQGSAPLRPVDVRAGATIRGTVLGARGPFVLLETLGAPVILDLASLRGHLVDLAPAAPAEPRAAQMSLF